MTEIVRNLDDRVREALIDSHVGVAPDAIDVRPSPHGFDFRYGPISPGESAPDRGIRDRAFELRIAFPEHAEPREIKAVVPRLKEVLGADPTLGGRFRPGSVRLREEDERLDPEGGWYGERSPLVTVPVMVSEIE
jgi:hypothetical protein